MESPNSSLPKEFKSKSQSSTAKNHAVWKADPGTTKYQVTVTSAVNPKPSVIRSKCLDWVDTAITHYTKETLQSGSRTGRFKSHKVKMETYTPSPHIHVCYPGVLASTHTCGFMGLPLASEWENHVDLLGLFQRDVLVCPERHCFPIALLKRLVWEIQWQSFM